MYRAYQKGQRGLLAPLMKSLVLPDLVVPWRAGHAIILNIKVLHSQADGYSVSKETRSYIQTTEVCFITKPPMDCFPK